MFQKCVEGAESREQQTLFWKKAPLDFASSDALYSTLTILRNLKMLDARQNLYDARQLGL